MNAVEVAERAATLVAEIELAMMDAGPAEMERLKLERQAARAHLELAEMQQVAEQAREQRHETPDELWEEWLRVRFLSRSRMSAKLKSAIIRKYGKANYERMPR